ncbi:sulfotransferase [Alkalilimnicola ehrlichii]|uniref:Sulfotransferase n=1 Tax=Alkalilimnicola ehrlichii TaxID=351052 RepID=A0A3E0WZ74_9GAMM|nr:sulfotransferase family 2 domain-containing protein [Alkalilimnicola ehrlichii]RFA30116.1 sulfotransferase [Alkalilimnicola ehrlichii]RFA37463.1 sulfotransferase [Alkalilimnicola ehrlichii]
MLVSYSHNFLFIHIAKTGGTSVRAALRKYRGAPRYAVPLFLTSMFSQMTRPRHKLGVKFPRHAKAIAAKEMLPAPIFNEMFKFAIVRNPWDLQVSSYHHIRREKPEVLEGVKSFEEFLRLKFDPERDYNYMLDISAERQWEYLADLNGNIIVDFIGRYERLQDDFATICDRIGIPTPTLPHERKAKDRSVYRDYYTEATAAMVAEHYQRDIELLNYSF